MGKQSQFVGLLPFAAVLILGTAAHGGSIRYDLPNLLGEHAFDGSFNLFDAGQVIDTPFGFYEAEQARLVIQGRVSSGMARGDGVLLEATEFELLPSVGVRPNFANSIEIQTEPTPETFRIENLYANPFVPETTPLPSPDGYPPVSFSVFLSVTPAFGTQYPPRLIDPPADTLTAYDGILVDVPIVAEIEQAYIILSGASIVPEPSGLALLCGSVLLLAGIRHRVGRYSVVAVGTRNGDRSSSSGRHVQGEPDAAAVVRAGLQPGEFPAEDGFAEGDRPLVDLPRSGRQQLDLSPFLAPVRGTQ